MGKGVDLAKAALGLGAKGVKAAKAFSSEQKANGQRYGLVLATMSEVVQRSASGNKVDMTTSKYRVKVTCAPNSPRIRVTPPPKFFAGVRDMLAINGISYDESGDGKTFIVPIEELLK